MCKTVVFVHHRIRTRDIVSGQGSIDTLYQDRGMLIHCIRTREYWYIVSGQDRGVLIYCIRTGECCIRTGECWYIVSGQGSIDTLYQDRGLYRDKGVLIQCIRTREYWYIVSGQDKGSTVYGKFSRIMLKEQKNLVHVVCAHVITHVTKFRASIQCFTKTWYYTLLSCWRRQDDMHL